MTSTKEKTYILTESSLWMKNERRKWEYGTHKLKNKNKGRYKKSSRLGIFIFENKHF